MRGEKHSTCKKSWLLLICAANSNKASGLCQREHRRRGPGLGARSCAEEGLDINVRKQSQVQVVRLRGDLKIGDAVDGLRQTMEDLLAGGDTQLVLNIAEVPMIDSSGIGLLVRSLTTAKQRGGSLKLVNPSKLALQTLKIVGLVNLFEIFQDEGQAVQSFS